MAQLGRLSARWEARLDKAVGEALILKEALLLFVRVWLEHNPPLEPELEDSAAMSANARFERYLDLLAQGLRGGRSIGAQHSHIARAAEDEALIAALGEEGAP